MISLVLYEHGCVFLRSHERLMVHQNNEHRSPWLRS